MSSLTSNYKPKNITLDAAIEKKILNYLSKFRLSAKIAYYIDSQLIFHVNHIDNPTIASDVKLYLWILNCLKNYILSSS